MTPHRPLRALLVDVPAGHARVLERTLSVAGWQLDGERASGTEQLSAALQRRGWNAVLYGGAGEGAVPVRKALALVRLADPHLPFLAVSPRIRAGDLAAVVHGLDADVPVVPDPASLPAALARALDAAGLRRRVGGAHQLLSAQQAITDAIATGLETDALAAHVLGTLGETLGWSCGAVWRPAPDGLLRCAGTWHTAGRPEVAALAESTAETAFAPGQGLPGRVYAFRRPGWVADVGHDGDEPRAALARRAGLMTAVAFPIAHGDSCAGVIEFFSRGINEPNGEVSALFATVGGQLAQYLERRRHERAEAAPAPGAHDERLRRLLDATGSLVAVLDAGGRVRLAGARTCAALGCEESSLLGRDWAQAAVPAADRPAFAAALAAANGDPASVSHALGAGTAAVRWRLARVQDGGEALVLLTGEPAADPAGDPVTGLAARDALEAAAAAAIDRARRDGGAVAAVQLDVDDVRLVSESLGEAAGEALLRTLCRRLRATLPEGVLLGLHGGDAIVALLRGAEAGTAGDWAGSALATLAEPVELPGAPAGIRVGASAGIATFPRDAADAEELLVRAARAAQRAKQGRRGTWATYEPGQTTRIDMLSTAAGLHRAMRSGELELYWQPIHGLRKDGVVGFEALLRWNHPERGLVAPAEFIPVAEQTGVIDALGDWVLDAVCAQQLAWAAGGLHPLLSFNLSPSQLRRPDFVERLTAQLRASGADPTRLTVELTESTLLEDPATGEALVRSLHGLGLNIALDDFGSGYSSLSRLRELPVSTLKIDRAFMQEVPERHTASAVVTAILQLARALGRTAVAEGVETEAQRAFLAEQGCPLAQGFLFGRPMRAAAARRLMAAPAPRAGAQSVSVEP